MVVAIIGLLTAIAIPDFIKSREVARKNICISNLRILYHALEEYMIDMDINYGITVSATGEPLVGPTGYIKEIPRCKYNNQTYGTLTTGYKPVCPNESVCPDHKL